METQRIRSILYHMCYLAVSIATVAGTGYVSFALNPDFSVYYLIFVLCGLFFLSLFFLVFYVLQASNRRD